MDAAGVIAYYVMDGDRPLTAESNGNTTYYLYGLGGCQEPARGRIIILSIANIDQSRRGIHDTAEVAKGEIA